jgi:hypothetical protein
MIKRIVVSIVVLSFMMLAGLAFLQGGSLHAAPAHTFAAPVQTSSQVQQTGSNGSGSNAAEPTTTDPEKPNGTAEDPGKETNLLGGGHQDQGQVDHQFEGVE